MAKEPDRAEVLARALADFPSFARSLVWILPKDGQRTTLTFRAIQRDYDRSRTNRDVVLKSRQIGATTLELARDVYRFVTQRGARVIVLCQSQTDHSIANKLSADITRMFDGLRHAGIRLDFEAESRTSWTMPSRDASLTLIEAGASEAAAAKKGRGGTFTRLHATEVSTWEYPEETLTALLQSVPNLPHTEVVFESTAKGSGNWFHSQFVAARAGTTGYRAHFYPWFAAHDDPTQRIELAPGEVITPQTEREDELLSTPWRWPSTGEVVRVAPEQVKYYRAIVAQNGQDFADQEYPSDPVRCFLSSGRKFFDMAPIEAMGARLVKPIEQTRGATARTIWKRPAPGEKFVIGVDAAEGLGDDGDWTYATVWGRRSCEHVATLRTQLRENQAAEALAELSAEFHGAELVVERNKGMALIGALERLNARVYYGDDGKPGIATTVSSRPVMLADLASAVRDGSLSTSDEALLAEMRAFVIDGRTGRPFAPGKQRKNGIGDDGIFSCAMAWAILLKPSAQVRVSTGGPRTAGALSGTGMW